MTRTAVPKVWQIIFVTVDSHQVLECAGHAGLHVSLHFWKIDQDITFEKISCDQIEICLMPMGASHPMSRITRYPELRATLHQGHQETVRPQIHLDISTGIYFLRYAAHHHPPPDDCFPQTVITNGELYSRKARAGVGYDLIKRNKPYHGVPIGVLNR